MARRRIRPKSTAPVRAPQTSERTLRSEDQRTFTSEPAPGKQENPQPASGGPASTRLWPYVLAILLLPLIVLWHKDSALYTPPWYADPWFYLGFFRNLVEFKRDMFYEAYYGSRLSWVLPGALVHSLFSPVAANLILHLTVQCTAVLSFFFVLRAVAGSRSAFLAAMVFSVCPWLWVATGWDYPDGAGIAYCLLAMALLTRSAIEPARKWSLLLAGAAMAGMAYSHLFLVSLLPLLPLYYAGLSWIRRHASIVGSIRALCLWAGAGFGIVTLAFCGLNYLLDGNFWFYGPSVAQARSMAKNFIYFRSIWANGQLEPWLWPGVAGSLLAIILIPARIRRLAAENNEAGLLLSVQLLLAIGWMAWMQTHGSTVLGHFPYASYLLPFVFLVLGISFFPAAGSVSARAYVLICCATAVIFAASWRSVYLVHFSPAVLRAITVMTAGVFAAALLWRKRVAGTLLAITGFACFTAVALDQTFYFNGASLHGNREQYRRIMHARERIEAVRRGRPIRFWFDQKEPDFHEYVGLNSLYLAEFSRLGDIFGEPPVEPRFPRGCEVPVDPGTLVVVTSQKEHAEEIARTALADCWRPFGMYPVVEAVEVVKANAQPYTLAMLRPEVDRRIWRPLSAVFDSQGKGYLHPVEGGLASVPLPLERWILAVNKADMPDLRVTTGGVKVRTPSGPYSLACRYGPLVAPSTGRYRIALQYTDRQGQFSLLALNSDESPNLAVDRTGHRAGSHREMSFWLNLKRGETVFLRIVNNGHGAASLLMEQVTINEVVAVN